MRLLMKMSLRQFQLWFVDFILDAFLISNWLFPQAQKYFLIIPSHQMLHQSFIYDLGHLKPPISLNQEQRGHFDVDTIFKFCVCIAN